MRCQPANAGPRKTSLSVSLPPSISLSLFPSFDSRSSRLRLSRFLSLFLSSVREARANTRSISPSFSLSFTPSSSDTFTAGAARQNPRNIHTASRELSASFSSRVRERERGGRCSLREREGCERERERERTLALRSLAYTHYSGCLPKFPIDRRMIAAASVSMPYDACYIHDIRTFSRPPLPFSDLVSSTLLHLLFVIAPVSPRHSPGFSCRYHLFQTRGRTEARSIDENRFAKVTFSLSFSSFR